MTEKPVSPNDISMPRCDVCGELATESARDVWEVPSETDVKTYKAGEWKHGCEKHPVVSRMFNLG